MPRREGVIQFNMDFTETTKPLNADVLREMNVWRLMLYRLRLIGRHRDRYGGYGYGNVSIRYGHPDASRAFAISGTQTGHLECLNAEHYALVTAWDIARNHVVAQGPVPPSSESMTHGILYHLDNGIGAVIHVHSPEIWKHAALLKIPATSPDARYGTPEMADQVSRLFQCTDVQNLRIFVMGGHEDGVFAFGDRMETAGMTIIRYLARAAALL